MSARRTPLTFVVLVDEPVGRIAVATTRVDSTRFALLGQPPLKNNAGTVAPPAAVADAVSRLSASSRAALIGGLAGGLAGGLLAWMGSTAQQQRPQAYPPPAPPPLDTAKILRETGMTKPAKGVKKNPAVAAVANVEAGWDKPMGAVERAYLKRLIAGSPTDEPTPRVERRAILLTEDLVQMVGFVAGDEPHWALALGLLPSVWVDPYTTMARMAVDPAVFEAMSTYGRSLAEVREKSGRVEPVLVTLAEYLRSRS